MSFTIEGNIGAGKTSVLRALEQKGFAVRLEPVHAWEGLLAEYYSELQGANTAAKQIAGLRLQARIMVDICLTDQTADFEERCGYTQPITFMRHMKKVGSLSEEGERALTKLNKALSQEPFHIIYLYCTPAIAMERVVLRNRGCESNVDQGFVSAMHDVYEKAMSVCKSLGVPVSTINVTHMDVQQVAQQVLDIRNARYKSVADVAEFALSHRCRREDEAEGS